MHELIQHRIVSAPTLTELWKRTSALQAGNWRTVDDPTIAVPANPAQPPYWTQAMSLVKSASAETDLDFYAAVVAAPSIHAFPGNSSS